MSTPLSDLLRHVAASATSQEMTVREVLDGCKTTATPADVLLLLDAERRRQGLKKYQLAKLCGVGASAFSKQTSARSSDLLKVKTLLMIAVGLGLLDSQVVAALPSTSTNGARQAKRTKVKRPASERPKRHPPQERSSRGAEPQAAVPDDFSTVGLREAAVMLDLPLPGLVELAETGLLPGAEWQGGRWRIAPAALLKLIQAKAAGTQAEVGMAELRGRLDVVEQTNKELQEKINVIESVRELILQHGRHGGSQPVTRVLDILPQLFPKHFKFGEPIVLGDLLRAYPTASAYSVELVASALLFPAPSVESVLRFGQELLDHQPRAAKPKKPERPETEKPEESRE